MQGFQLNRRKMENVLKLQQQNLGSGLDLGYDFFGVTEFSVSLFQSAVSHDPS